MLLVRTSEAQADGLSFTRSYQVRLPLIAGLWFLIDRHVLSDGQAFVVFLGLLHVVGVGLFGVVL